MSLIREIRKQIHAKKMLSHPFYKDWVNGKLSRAQLQNYAVQYKPFVDAFPRFVSAIHSQCSEPVDRHELTKNLMDEEGFGSSLPHPVLWENFASGIGADLTAKVQPESYYLRDTFLALCHYSYEEGLCALYSYEAQIPEVAKAKIKGLEEHYGISDSKALEFFEVHQEADIHHSEDCGRMIERIPDKKNMLAMAATIRSTSALWDFLSSVH